MELRYYLIYILSVTLSATYGETDTTSKGLPREKRHSHKHYPAAVKYSQPDPFLQKSIELGNITHRKDVAADASNVYNHFAPAQWKLKNPSALYRGGPSGIRPGIRPPPNTVRQVNAAFVRSQPPPRPPHQLFQPPPPEQPPQQSYSAPQSQTAYAAPQQPQTAYAAPQPSYSAPQPTAHGHLIPPHVPPSSQPHGYPDPHSGHPPPSYGPPSHPPYVDNEPIIEIIIKESNETLPPPPPIIIPTTPKPAKEPIQVFYVKYKKKPASDNSGKEEIEYEEPIPALTPLPVEHEETPVTEGYGPPEHVPAVEYPVPRQPSTTLRTIIKPDSEAYHSTGGLKVTFGETVKTDGSPTYAKRDSKKLRKDDEEDDTEKKDSVGGHSEVRSSIFPFTNPDREFSEAHSEFSGAPNALREIPAPEFNRIGRKQGSEYINSAPGGAASSNRFREPLFVEDGSFEGPPAPTFDLLRENPAQSFAALRQNRPPSYERPNSLPSFENVRQNPSPSFEPSRQSFETSSRPKAAPSFESLRQLQNQLNQAPQRPKFNPTLETPQSNIVAFPGPTDARTIADLKAQREEHEKLQYKIQQQYLNLDQSEPKPTQPQYLIHPQKEQSLGFRLNPQQQRLYQQQLFELVQKEQQLLQQKQIEQAFQKSQNQHRFQATEQSKVNKNQQTPPNFNKILSPEQFRLNEAIFNNQPKIPATQRQPEIIPSNDSPTFSQPKIPINVQQQQPESPLSFEEQIRLYQQFTQLQPTQQNNVPLQQQTNQSPQQTTQQLSNDKLQQLLQEYYRNQQLQQYFNQRGQISQNSAPDPKPQQIFESSQQNKFVSSPSKENVENSQNSDSQIFKSIPTIENHEIFKSSNSKVNYQQKEPTVNQEQDDSPFKISQNNDARNENQDSLDQAQRELIQQYQANARKEQEKQYQAQRAQKEELDYQAAQKAQNDELAYQAQKKAALKAYNDELAYQAQKNAAQKAKDDELAYQARAKAAEKAKNEELAYQAQRNAEQKAKSDQLAYQIRIKAAEKARDEELAYQAQIKNAQKAYQEELENRQREEQIQMLSKVAPTPSQSQSSQQNTRKNSATDKAKIKAKLESLPEEVPDDVRQQLLSSGILNNADIQILDYDKVGDIPIENLPPEALEQLKGSHSEPVPAVLSNNNNNNKTTTMKVVRYNSNTEEGQKVQKSYLQTDATLVDPVVLNDTNYNRYLPLKVAGAQFPIPDSPLLRGKNITSVVILAPVEYNFAGSENRTAKVVAQVEDIKFVAGDLIKNVVKRPSRRNFERWLDKEKVSSPSKQSVIMLVANAKENNVVKNEIFMYDIGTEDISKLEGQLSSAFVEVAETNATEDLVSNISPEEEETNEITTAIPFYGISDQRKKKSNRRNASKIA